MNDLPPWMMWTLAAVAVAAVLLGLRVASVRKQRAALDAARLLADERQQHAAHQQAAALAQAQSHAQALADAQRRNAEAAARLQAQAVLLAQRQAAAAEREARRHAADEAARQHAQALVDKRIAERAAGAARAPTAAPAARALPATVLPPTAPATARMPAPPWMRPAPAPSPAASSAPSPAPSRNSPRTRADTVVLVADDSKVVRVKLGRLLAQHGFQVLLAEDGLAALRQMQLQAPHVLLTDAEMPGLDGLELTRRVRSQPQLAHIMVLMISSADGSLGPAASAAGVTALLGKPYAEDRLLALLDSVRRPSAAPA